MQYLLGFSDHRHRSVDFQNLRRKRVISLADKRPSAITNEASAIQHPAPDHSANAFTQIEKHRPVHTQIAHKGTQLGFFEPGTRPS